MSNLYLEIVTPERAFYDGEVERVIVRGLEGDLAILKGRSPMATPLKIGRVKVLANGEEKVAAVVDGYVTVLNDKVTIVTDCAEWPEEIDINRARAAQERAEKRLQAKQDVDLLRAEAALKRAINRLNVAEEQNRAI